MALQWARANDYETMSRDGAASIFAAVEKGLAERRPVLLGLATGNTMIELYAMLADTLNRHRLDLSQLHTFNLDEYVGNDGHWVPVNHPLSYRAYMEKQFFGRLDPKLGMDRNHIYFPDARHPAAFDDLIRGMGGLDFQLLGVGFNGHIAFNEPMSEAEISAEAFAALPSRLIDLTELTIATNAQLTADGDWAKVPRRAVTMGMQSLLAAREILLLACFPQQREPLRQVRLGRITPRLPAGYLLGHPHATILYTADTISMDGGN
jgi:glucosamine-6-phosphate deaminase